MSKYSREDIIRMVEDEDVEFIRLQFTDIFGILKNVAITASQLDNSVQNGGATPDISSKGLYPKIHCASSSMLISNTSLEDKIACSLPSASVCSPSPIIRSSIQRFSCVKSHCLHIQAFQILSKKAAHRIRICDLTV